MAEIDRRVSAICIAQRGDDVSRARNYHPFRVSKACLWGLVQRKSGVSGVWLSIQPLFSSLQPRSGPKGV